MALTTFKEVLKRLESTRPSTREKAASVSFQIAMLNASLFYASLAWVGNVRPCS